MMNMNDGRCSFSTPSSPLMSRPLDLLRMQSGYQIGRWECALNVRNMLKTC